MNAPGAGGAAVAPDRLRQAGLPFASVGDALQHALYLHQQDEPDKVGEAEQIYRRVLVVEPENSDALHYLGLVAHQFGESEAGIDLMRRSIALQPTSALYFRNLAGVLRDRKRYGEAIEAYRQSLSINPDYPEVQLKLAELYADMGDLDATDELHRQIIDKHPRSALLQHQVALAAVELGDFDTALTHALAAVELNYLYADALNTLGIVYSNLGNFEAAVESLRKAVKLQPRNCQAHFNLMAVQRVKPDSPDLQALEALHEQIDQFSRDDAVLIEFALGKSYEDCRDYDRAFGHFLAGNRLKYGLMNYSGEKQAKFFDNMCRVFDADKFDRHRQAGLDSTTPIFILGLSRSGTTLIEQIIASHPDVYGGGELKTLYQSIDTASQTVLHDYDIPDLLAKFTDPELRQLAEDYLSRVQRLAQGKGHVTDKLPGNVVMTGLIHVLFPRAPMIFIRRDPRDTCTSCFTKLFATGHDFTYDLTELGEFYVLYDRLMRHWQNVLPVGRVLEIRYEDLVDDFENQVRRIIDYCGLPWDDACLHFHDSQSRVRTASLYQVRQPIYKSSVGRWRRYESHLQPLLDALAPVLAEE